MNADRRKRIKDIVKDLRGALGALEEVKEDEQAAFDNMPESLQDGERGQKIQEGLDSMDNITGDLETAIDSLDEIINA